MSFEPIHPTNDSRVTHEYARLNNRQFHYVIGNPTSGNEPKKTVVLIHGFPDLWYGWRHTIPALLALDLRVIAIDCIGYGGTDAPRCPPESLFAYGIKQTNDGIADLLKKLNVHKAVIIGHDWGAMTAYRFVNHHPDLTSHLVTISVPYAPPLREYKSLDEVVKQLPNFTYQLALSNPQTADDLRSKDAIRHFLRGLHRGVNETVKAPGSFNVPKGIVSSMGTEHGLSKILTEAELEYYTEQYYAKGFDGPLNWYRTREINWKDDLAIEDENINVPTLFINSDKDRALPPTMAVGMDKYFSSLTKRSVSDAGHWVMTEKSEELNGILKEWFEGVVFGGEPKL